MHRLLTILVFCAVVLGLAYSFLPGVASAAYDPFKQACSASGANGSVVCQTSPVTKNPLTGTQGTLTRIANIVALIAGVAAVVMIVISGIRYSTSSGDSKDISEAKKGIIAALIGLVVIVIARLLVSLIAKGVS